MATDKQETSRRKKYVYRKLIRIEQVRESPHASVNGRDPPLSRKSVRYTEHVAAGARIVVASKDEAGGKHLVSQNLQISEADQPMGSNRPDPRPKSAAILHRICSRAARDEIDDAVAGTEFAG